MFLITMVNYDKLFKKYYKKEGANLTAQPKTHKAEKSSNQSRKQRRLQASQKHRYLILQQLKKEVPFHITKTQTEQIKYWITTFNDNFKNFHRKASEETIILALILIQHKQANPKIQIERYSISKKYKLTLPKFTLIQNRLIFYLMGTTELTYTLKIKEIHENKPNTKRR